MTSGTANAALTAHEGLMRLPARCSTQSRAASAAFTSLLLPSVTRKDKGKLSVSQTARTAARSTVPVRSYPAINCTYRPRKALRVGRLLRALPHCHRTLLARQNALPQEQPSSLPAKSVTALQTTARSRQITSSPQLVPEGTRGNLVPHQKSHSSSGSPMKPSAWSQLRVVPAFL